MRLTTVGASYSRTQNTGNYNSLRVEVNMEATLEADDDPATVAAILASECKALVRKRLEDDRASYVDDWPR